MWNNKILSSICVVVGILFPIVCQAAPGKPSVSGTVGNTSTITITGVSFGAGPNIVTFDNFESGTVGANISTGSGSATVGQWNARDTSGSSYYGNTASVSGTKAFNTNYSVHYSNWIEALLPANTKDVFMSWWLYLPSGNNYPGEGGTGTNWKQMWIQGADTGDDDLVTPTLVNTSWIVNGNDQDPGYVNYTSTGFTKGTWMRLATWVKGSTSSTSGDGEFKFYSMGIERENATGVNTLKAGGYRERVRPNGYGRQTSNCVTSFDDIYIASGANAQARIELCNSATYANCTKFGVAIPTSWGASSITSTLYTGNFTAGETAYLYVWDANGERSLASDALSIGSDGGGGEDITPPVRSLLAPSGTLTVGTTSTTISLVTDEAATCRYSTTSGVAYADMTLSFDSSYALSHSATVSGLTNGGSYNRYVRCINGSGYANTDDAVISFAVASEAASAGSLSWQYSTYSADRSDGRIPINIVRTGGSTGSVTVQWSSNGQTALHNVDYYGNDGVTVTFADGVTTMPVNTYGTGEDGIEMIANGADDDRYFQMILSNPTGGSTLGTTLATVTIEGDYVAPVAAVPRIRTSTGAPLRAYGGGHIGVTQ